MRCGAAADITVLRLAIRNVVRQRLRTAITLAAVVFGVAGIVVSGGFIRDILRQLGEAVIHSQSGHIRITRMGTAPDAARKPNEDAIPSPARVLARIEALPQVADVMARSTFSALLNNGRADLAVVGEGIEPDKEARLGTHVSLLAGRLLTDADVNGALLGEGVATALKLAPGDRATLVTTTAAGAMNTIDIEVTGVVRSFSKDYDARVVKVPLTLARELTDSDGVNMVVVSLLHTDDTEAVASSIRPLLRGEDLVVTTWPHLNDFYEKAVALYDRQFAVLQLIIVISVMLSVANSMNMSVSERIPEFGTMRALGNRSVTVFGLVVTEASLIGVAGGALGVMVGIPLAAGISAVGIPMPPPPGSDVPYVARVAFAPSAMLVAFAAATGSAIVAGGLSALRVSRVPLAAALRSAR